MSSNRFPATTRRVRVSRHPIAGIDPDSFAIDACSFHPPSGHVVTQTEFISVDPYLALNMNNAMRRSESVPYDMRSRTVGVVVDAGDSPFRVGDRVLGFGAWSEYDFRPARELRLISPEGVPVSAFLGVLGHSGVTAWLGLRVGGAKPGETVLVSGAAGAVGSTVGQLARRLGCHTIGIAGGEEKVRFVVDRVGFDECLDYRSADFEANLQRAAGAGVDLLFENVGGRSLDPALAVMKRGGRVALCGLVQHYQTNDPVQLHNFRLILERVINIRPFSIYDHGNIEEDARRDLLAAAQSGDLLIEETMSFGLDKLPSAFAAMLRGEGRGKHVVNVLG